ncbi:MAG TPA: MoaD/ThiS family protein [Methylomirabilota bacterium]|nr:MoaD/ThiS family protein [Methylomirabilota bacterium]
MVQVKLSGSFKSAAGGLGEVEVEAVNIHQLLTRLAEEHPKLKPMLDRGVAVSIDGQIYRDDRFRAIPPGSEVFLLPRMAGG